MNDADAWKEYRQSLWNHMAGEHSLDLLESELNDIEQIVFQHPDHVKAVERIKELEAERDRLKAELDGEGTRLVQCRAEVDSLTASQQMCVGAAGIGDFSELCGWIDDKKSQVESLEKQCGLLRSKLGEIKTLPWSHIVTQEVRAEIGEVLSSTTAGRDYFKVCPKCHYEASSS